MTQERSVAATVIDQEGNEVKVEHRGKDVYATMIGFPPGFRLRPGERVILRDEPEGGLSARPLVRAVASPVRQEGLRPDHVFEAEGGPHVVSDRAVISGPAPGEWERVDPHEGVLWVVDPGSSKDPPQVIAARVRR